MRALVCGNRRYANRAKVFEQLDYLHTARPITVVIHGACPPYRIWTRDALVWAGADYMADQWAAERGVEVKKFPADWDRYNKAAGPIRNRQMLEEGKPDIVVAFPGRIAGPGTTNMIMLAQQAKVWLWKVEG